MADLAPTAANVVKQSTTTVGSGIAGETITAGMTVYLKSSDSRYWKADANVTNAEAVVAGVALNSCSAGQPISFATGGTITLGTVTAGSAGVVVAQSTTAGGLAPDGDIASGNYYTLIGILVSATELKIGIIVTNVTHA